MPEKTPKPADCFTFTEREQLWDRISHQRFLDILNSPDVEIHEVKEDVNSFGEYLFVLVSCRTEQPRWVMTFYGLGFHEQRERWITDSWQWYESTRKVEKMSMLPKAQAMEWIQDREIYVKAHAQPTPQSPQAQLFELIAELTDEDGALSELDDLGWMLFAGPYDDEGDREDF